MTVTFHPEAGEEFLGAVEFYENRQPGLGLELAIEVKSAVQHIVAFPDAWPVLDGEIRRCLIRRFPYGILYTVISGELWIVAVMHLHRDPDYWKHRGP